jgi:acetate kinase
VVCHIGGGVSVNAVKDGVSVDSTMGYSPSSGLPMGSRAGDIDPGGLLQLMRSKNLKPSETEMYINTKGGLFGLSELSDIRHLLDRKSKGDAVATQTLGHFVYHIQKAIAASVVPLGGLDMLVLTGTASVRSGELRSMILGDLEYLGISIDNDKNDLLVGQDGVFSTQKSKVKTVVIRTDEMGEMAQVVDLLDLPKD